MVEMYNEEDGKNVEVWIDEKDEKTKKVMGRLRGEECRGWRELKRNLEIRNRNYVDDGNEIEDGKDLEYEEQRERKDDQSNSQDIGK
jgi:hypothetical protein